LSIRGFHALSADYFQQFADLITQNPKSLKKLDFNFSNNSDLTNENFAFITTRISHNFTNLERLSLDFSQCPLISDEDVQLILKGLCSNPQSSLKELSLDFSENPLLTEASIITIGPVLLSHLKELESLSLIFHSIETIANKGIIEFFRKFSKTSTSLKKLHLNFNGCNNITNQLFDALKKELSQGLGSIQTLEINFAMIQSIDHKVFADFIQSINKEILNVSTGVKFY